MFAKNALRLLQNVCHTRYMVFRTREYLPYTVYEPRFVTASSYIVSPTTFSASGLHIPGDLRNRRDDK